MSAKPEKAATIVVDAAPQAGGRKGVLTVTGGNLAGQVLAVGGQEMISLGRDPGCTYLFDDASLSRTHARILQVAGEYVLRDDGSTNGTFVNDKRISAATKLKDGDRIQLGSGTFLRFALVSEQEEAALRQVYDAATRDALTGAVNRKTLEDRLAREIAAAVSGNTELSVTIMDVDFFKKVNDTFGHLAGDAVLTEVSRRLREYIRPQDTIGRYGGEEFVVLTTGITVEQAVVVAEHMRRLIEATPITFQGQQIAITASAGVASLRCCGARPDRETLLGTADGRLYRAKESGRNRVVGP